MPARLNSALLILLAWLGCNCTATAAPDGPYVLRDPGGGWEAVYVIDSPEGPRRQSQSIKDRGLVTVPAVGDIPAFTVALRDAAKPSPDIIKGSARAPMFVVADTHGEYDILVAQLRKHGIVDERLRWSFGRGRMVILGDVFDRGAWQLEILWLLYKLEAEAAKAGGGSHLVLGNHETSVLRGDQRYLHPKYVETSRVLELANYSELFPASSVLGQWLRSRPAVLKVNDALCLHGGISRAFLDSGMQLPEINATIRALMSGSVPVTDAERQRADLLFGQSGPLWYRGYFPELTNFVTATMEDVDLTLKHFGVQRVLIGHTVVRRITPLYDGKVIAVQVYPRRGKDGVVSFESLLVRDGQLWRASPLGLEPLAPPAASN